MIKKRLTAFLLSLLMTVSGLQGLALQPGDSFLDSSDQVRLDSGIDSGVAQPPQSLVYTEESILVSDLLASAAVRGRSISSSWYGDRLTGETRIFYDYLLQWLMEIEQGGALPSYYHLSGATTDLDSNKMFVAVKALLRDRPELFYWFEKGEGALMTALVGKDSDTGIQKIYLICPVVEAYRGAPDPLTLEVSIGGVPQFITYGAWVVTPNRGGDDEKALLIANEIVEQARQFKTPYEKIRFFNQKICDLTSYRYDSLLPGAPYDGAFQMFDVFLGRPVVCEGYSKAFWYLCNQAGIECLIVEGVLTAYGVSENHMWNVVSLDGKWYLVDVTNNDDAGDIEWLLAIGSENPIMQYWEFAPSTIGIGDGISISFDLILSRDDYRPYVQEKPTAGGGGSDSAPPAPKTILAQKLAADGKSLAQQAEQAAARGEASVLLKDAALISPQVMRQVADAAKENPMTIYADVTDERGVALRFFVDPVKGAALSNDLLLTARVNDRNTAAIFSHYFNQTVAAVAFDHKGAFGMPVSVAVRLDLSGLDAEKLQFYSYDSQANTYLRLANLPHRIDSAGYLHLTLTQGGALVVTDRPLGRK